MNWHQQDGPMVQVWPRPKVGDAFSIELEVREGSIRKLLRRLGVVKAPIKTFKIRHVVREVGESDGIWRS